MKRHRPFPIHYIALLLTVLWLFSACRKQVQTLTDSSNDAQISFICASPQLISELGRSGNAPIMVDYAGNIFPPPEPLSVYQPSFNSQQKFIFPTTSFNETLEVGWSFYMHLYPGTHTITVLDTGLFPRNSDTCSLKANAPVSAFYADSMGYFSSFFLEDKFSIQDSQVSLRLVNLCPDAGNVFFTIDQQAAPALGFASSYSYGQSSPFINYPNPSFDTLRIYFYQAGDSIDVIAREFLPVFPGHAYTFTLQGYVNPSPMYTDPVTGDFENLSGGISTPAYQNY